MDGGAGVDTVTYADAAGGVTVSLALTSFQNTGSAGFDKIVILAVSPQFLDGELIGTVDSYGITGVPGPPSPEKCNDYIAAIAAAQPEVFIGYASVNPAYRGPRAAVRELERAVTELGLRGLKLYPMYQDWSPADPVLAFPVFAKAEELFVKPPMVEQPEIVAAKTPGA